MTFFSRITVDGREGGRRCVEKVVSRGRMHVLGRRIRRRQAGRQAGRSVGWVPRVWDLVQ